MRRLAPLACLLFVLAGCAVGRTEQPPPGSSTPGASTTPVVGPTSARPTESATATIAGATASPPTPLTPTAPACPAPLAGPAVPVYGYRVVHSYPHDPEAWTQGLVWQQGVLYESTGQLGHSTLRRVDLESGEVLQFYALPDEYYGEGIAAFDGRIIQLTWRSHLGFVYDKESFSLIRSFGYPTEGWGLTYDGEHLIVSDGTATLRFLDTDTLSQTGEIQVCDGQVPVANLNELEYVQGEVYANVWLTDRIARIDAQTGRVLGWIDLTGLLYQEDTARRVSVLNGIAYDAQNDRLFVTGKHWPRLFEIELVPPG